MDDVFDALGDRTRRRILVLLATGERTVGALVDELQSQGRISQPAVSQHLKTLRDTGLVVARTDGTRRHYRIAEAGIEAARAWLAGLADPLAPFGQPLDALATEVARGQRSRRTGRRGATSDPDAQRGDRSA